MLARGELQTIGATTLDEYRKHLEKDAALERRFQPIQVGEPSLAHTIEILKGLRDRYEAHHRVSITDSALVAAATLADRYISDRFLPDKAIDLIDEAGSRMRIRRMTAPPDLREYDERIAQVRRDKESAIDAQDFEKAANLRDKEKQLLAEKAQREKEWKAGDMDVVAEVTDEEIAEVLATWTGIPVFKLTEEETARLLRMEDELHKRIIGQEDAVRAVSQAIRRTRAGLKDPKRPGGSFIFAGPSGVGKTELSKTLADFLFGDEEALIQLDMSEFMEKHTVSRLVGSPPGYVGYEEGGQLTERVRRKPFSVVLFDEVEKAHPDVFNTLLQVLEDGRLTDSQGRAVDFKNTVIIMTTNLGTRDIAKGPGIGFCTGGGTVDYDRMKAKVQDELKQHFRPEFLNRVDDTIVFHQLSTDDIVQIVDLMLNRVDTQMKNKDMGLELTRSAKELLAERGYDSSLGARPLRRTIQREIEDALSEKILFGELRPGQIVVVDTADGPRTVARSSPSAARPSPKPYRTCRRSRRAILADGPTSAGSDRRTADDRAARVGQPVPEAPDRMRSGASAFHPPPPARATLGAARRSALTAPLRGRSSPCHRRAPPPESAPRAVGAMRQSRQAELPAGLDQAVVQQPGERAFALHVVGPHHLKGSSRYGSLGVAQHRQQPPAHLPVGARVALRPPGRAVVERVAGGPPGAARGQRARLARPGYGQCTRARRAP